MVLLSIQICIIECDADQFDIAFILNIQYKVLILVFKNVPCFSDQSCVSIGKGFFLAERSCNKYITHCNFLFVLLLLL